MLFKVFQYMCGIISKTLDTSKNYKNMPSKGRVWFYNAVMPPKDANGMANSVDSDQTAP